MFKEFKISDVFYKIDTPKIKAKANDFPTEYSEEYCVPLLTAGAENQGLNRYAKTSDCPMIINNAISVSANGANSGICFYQPHDFAVLQDAYAIKVNGREIDGVEEGLYLTGALNKAVRDNHDWVNKAGWNHIKDDSIELPVIESSDADHAYTVDDIDWQYMRDRITELERDRITELDAYLQATFHNNFLHRKRKNASEGNSGAFTVYVDYAREILYNISIQKEGCTMSYYSEMLEVELKRNRQAQSVFQHNLDRIGNFSLYLVRRKGRTYVYKKEIFDGKSRSFYVGTIDSPESESARRDRDDIKELKEGLKQLKEDERKLMKAIEVLK